MSFIKRVCCLFAAILTATISYGQISAGGRPVGNIITTKAGNVATSKTVNMPSFEIPETLNSQGSHHKTLKFAHTFEVDLSSTNSGTWSTLDNGQRVWQLNITSEDAKSINIIFSKFRLPEGGELFIYNSDMSHIIGAFTHNNNKDTKILPTMPVVGDNITIEYKEPINPAFDAELTIGKVNHDYTGIIKKSTQFGLSQSCEIDRSCYPDEPYETLSRSVVKLLINGNELMTGTLINNTRNDGSPYVLTASHGYINAKYIATTTLFIFNYGVPYCNSSIEGTEEQSIAGGTMLAHSPNEDDQTLDFALVEMSVAPPIAYRPYYVGWSRSTTIPNGAFCIHHPNGDVKKISFENDPLFIDTLFIGSIDYYFDGHWVVSQWDEGVTEGGSSGSAIFSSDGKLRGGLSGGSASCLEPYLDYYYRFDLSWDASEEDDRQLATWLDKDGSDVESIEAYDPCNYKNTQQVSHISEASNITYLIDSTTGFVAGTNTVGINYFVEKFENDTPKELLGFYFAAAIGHYYSDINISIWSGNEFPEVEIYNKTLAIKKWTYTSEFEQGEIGGGTYKGNLGSNENYVTFMDTSIIVTENYFIGFEVDNSNTDYLFGLYVDNTDGNDNALYYDTDWHSYKDLNNYNKSISLWVEAVVQDVTVSDSGSFNDSSFTVYPNPIGYGMDLKITTNELESSDIKIYDILGRNYTIGSIMTENNISYINIDNLPSGTYIIKIKDDSKLFQKLAK